MPENIAGTEAEILEGMEEVVRALEDASTREADFFDKARQGVEPQVLDDHIADFHIFLEDDIRPTLQQADQKVAAIRDSEGFDPSEKEAETFKLIEEALGMLEKEEVRLEKILETAEQKLENGVEPEKIAEELEKFEMDEERQVIDQIETKIMYAQNNLKEEI